MSPAAETTTSVRPETAEETSVQPIEPVVVHVRIPAYTTEMVRVWQSTFLLDRDSNHTSRLLSFEKISLYPHWMPVPFGRPYQFTLFFEPLPKSVQVFDLHEIIPEPRGWHFPGIRRNDADVYWLDLPN